MLGLREQMAALTLERRPGDSQLDAPARPVQQRHPELTLEPADLVAQRGL